MRRTYGPEIKKEENAFWERVKWLKKQKKNNEDQAAAMRGKHLSVKAHQSRFKAKPVTLPKLGGDV